MDAVDSMVDPLREFAKDSIRLVKRCHKPDRKGSFRLLFRFSFLFSPQLLRSLLYEINSRSKLFDILLTVEDPMLPINYIKIIFNLSDSRNFILLMHLKFSDLM